MKKKIIIIFIFLISSTFAKADNVVKKQYNYNNFGIIISGPSGVGKTTIVERLAKKHPELLISTSATTRKKRKGEIDGKSYYFMNKEDFKQLIKKGEFIEYAKNYGNYYGSPKKNYTNAINNNKDIAFVLSVKGMKNAIKNKKMDFVTIFIQAKPDDIFKRLTKRATETKEQLSKRFKNIKHETSYSSKYDYIVYNDNLENAVKITEAIYLAERLKRLKK